MATASDPRADDELRLGRAALPDGDVASVVAHLQSAAILAPRRSDIHRALAAVFAADGQYDHSIQEFTAALEADPADERSWAALADTLATDGRLAQVEPVLQQGLRRFPKSGQLHFTLGRLYQSLGKHAEAVREFEAALAARPPVGVDALYEMVGTTYVTLADFEHAADTWTKRLERRPNSPDTHRRLAEAYLRQDRDEEALGEFSCALWLDPRNADVHAAVAQLHLRLGRYADAVAAAERALNVNAGQKDAQYVLGMALRHLGRIEDGARHLQEFERLQTEASAADTARHDLERAKHDAAISLTGAEYGKAAGFLRRAAELEPDSAPTQLALGFALLADGHPAEAIPFLQKAVQLDAAPDGHRYLAQAFRMLGRLDESRQESAVYQESVQRLKKQRLRQLAQVSQ
jgi:tetratricopeptide (TPR) repeat protein